MSPDELRELERRRLRSLVEADMATAEELHADEYELVPPGGVPISRAAYLGAIASGAIRYRVFEADSEVRVRLLGEGGVLRYVARIDIEFDGQVDVVRAWHTDIYEARGGRWQAIWSQATQLPKGAGE